VRPLSLALCLALVTGALFDACAKEPPINNFVIHSAITRGLMM
jgi:hypothetical protein